MTLHQAEAQTRILARRRIDAGKASVSLLARLSGYGQPHISNWIGGKRDGSIPFLAAMLTCLGLGVEIVPATQPSLVRSMHGVPDPEEPHRSGPLR